VTHEFFLRPYPLGRKQVQGRFAIPSGKFFLSHTALNGRMVLRLAIGNLATAREDVSEVWNLIRQAVPA